MLQHARTWHHDTWRGVNEEGILFGIGNSAFGGESQRYYVRCKEAHSASATDACGRRFEYLDIHTATVVLVLDVHRDVSNSLTLTGSSSLLLHVVI
jgi:hypothetical protein